MFSLEKIAYNLPLCESYYVPFESTRVNAAVL